MAIMIRMGNITICSISGIPDIPKYINDYQLQLGLAVLAEVPETGNKSFS